MRDDSFIGGPKAFEVDHLVFDRLGLGGKDLLAFCAALSSGPDPLLYSYLTRVLGCSKPTAVKVMRGLEEVGYLRSHTETVNGACYRFYEPTPLSLRIIGRDKSKRGGRS